MLRIHDHYCIVIYTKIPHECNVMMHVKITAVRKLLFKRETKKYI